MASFVTRYKLCMVTTYSKGKDQPGKVANPARGQLEQGKCIFPRPRSRLRMWSRGTGSAVPPRVKPSQLSRCACAVSSLFHQNQSREYNKMIFALIIRPFPDEARGKKTKTRADRPGIDRNIPCDMHDKMVLN